MLERTCEQCNKIFKDSSYNVKMGRGRFCSRECVAKFHKTEYLGRKPSPETLKKLSESHKGQKAWNKGKKNWMSEQGKKNMIAKKTGTKHSLETRIKMSAKHKGELHHNWQGGITPINFKIRNSMEMKLWRESVFKRDNYKCIWCETSGYLEADHIKPFAYYPELRFAIDNGRTLCKSCHLSTSTYGGRTK